MSDAQNAEAASTITDGSADEEKVESRDDEAPVYIGSDEVKCARPNVQGPKTAGFPEEGFNLSSSGREEDDKFRPGEEVGHLADGDTDASDMS